jgi:hypothetical protein
MSVMHNNVDFPLRFYTQGLEQFDHNFEQAKPGTIFP